jgi:hypothetical protein
MAAKPGQRSTPEVRLFLALADFLGHDFLVELFRLAPRHRERFPLPGLQMLGQKYNLPAMIRIVRNLAVDGLHDRVRLAPDQDRALDVRIRQRFER